MKRFTATEKWGKEWFHALKPRLKCFWMFVCDQADACGVWEPNFGLASYQVGEKVGEKDMAAFGDRMVKLPNGKYLIVSFVEFQYGTLSTSCPAHKPVYRALDKNHISIPYVHSGRRVQEEEEEEEEEGGGEGGGELLPPEKKLPGTPQTTEALAVAKIFHRRPSTPWAEGEVKAFKKIMPLDCGDLELISRYYESERKKVDPKTGSESGFHRRNLLTFLNNYLGELDRAREWARRNPTAAAKPLRGEVGVPTAEVEPEGFRAWMASEYPRADAATPYAQIPADIRTRFAKEAA